jgi:hypothetical protein
VTYQLVAARGLDSIVNPGRNKGASAPLDCCVAISQAGLRTVTRSRRPVMGRPPPMRNGMAIGTSGS